MTEQTNDGGGLIDIRPEDVGLAAASPLSQAPDAHTALMPNFAIGDVVIADDRNNVGEVVDVQPGRVVVRFLDKHTGRVADLQLLPATLQLVRRRPEARELKFLSYDDLMALAANRWLVLDVLRSGELGVVYGPPGSLKTFIALALALSVASGQDLWGRPVKKGRVLYVAAEGLYSIRLRTIAWKTNTGGDSEVVATLAQNLTVLGDAVSFIEPEFEVLLEHIRQRGSEYDLIVVDTLARCMAGGDENSSKDMGLMVRACDRLRKLTGATVLLVHHSGKGDAEIERGSSALRGGADAMLCVKRPDEKKPLVHVSCSKQKEGEPFPDFGLELQVVDVGFDADGRPVRSGSLKVVEIEKDDKDDADAADAREHPTIRIQRVLAESFFEDGAPGTELRAATGLKSATYHRHLKTLCKEGKVVRGEKRGHYRYTLTEGSTYYVPPAPKPASDAANPTPTPTLTESRHSHESRTPEPVESHSHSHAAPLGAAESESGTRLFTEGRIHE